MNTIQENWNDYKNKVLPLNVSEIQKKIETEKAFYARAWATLLLLTNIGSEKISEEAGVEIIQGLLEECELFSKGILKEVNNDAFDPCPDCGTQLKSGNGGGCLSKL